MAEVSGEENCIFLYGNEGLIVDDRPDAIPTSRDTDFMSDARTSRVVFQTDRAAAGES
jgi:hypothetical protein